VALIVVVALLGAVGVLFGYFVYSPAPEVPRLSGTLTQGSIEVGGRTRAYLTYAPLGLTKEAPLVVVMHGSGQNGAQTRKWTGYGFERLADERGFAVVYPDGYEGYWNACNIVGDYAANKLRIDDVGFVTGMVDKLITEIGVDPHRVFATGTDCSASLSRLRSATSFRSRVFSSRSCLASCASVTSMPPYFAFQA
jgi:polyhydroxybutyrate depolymerase